MTHFISRSLLSTLPFALLAALPGCTTNEGDTIYQQYGGAPNDGAPGRDGKDGKDGQSGKDGKDGKDGQGDGTGGTGALPERYPSHLPECEAPVSIEELDINLFGEDGHSFYFEVTPAARVLSDEERCDHAGGGPVYELGGSSESCPPSAINVRVIPAGGGACADTGKVELDLPGQSSWRPWNEIPNFKLDVGEFIDQKFKSGDKTIRMNNGQADSTIVREATALAIWRAMGYPAPRTRFVKTQSNVWDYEFEPGVFAAHVMVQPYKKAFFSQELPDVTSAWEGEGNPFAGWSNLECEWSKGKDCEDSVLKAIMKKVNDAPRGAGFMAATADVIDWPMLHRNQCLSALTGTGDDWIHNSNNVVIALRNDGKIFYLPYSTDISGGHPWYPSTPYDGYYDENPAVLCALDPECRQLALDTCEEMIDEFEELNVVEAIIEERCDTLEDTNLKRPADEDVCDSLADFYSTRPDELREEIEYLRESEYGGGMGGSSSY